MLVVTEISKNENILPKLIVLELEKVSSAFKILYSKQLHFKLIITNLHL